MIFEIMEQRVAEFLLELVGNLTQAESVFPRGKRNFHGYFSHMQRFFAYEDTATNLFEICPPIVGIKLLRDGPACDKHDFDLIRGSNPFENWPIKENLNIRHTILLLNGVKYYAIYYYQVQLICILRFLWYGDVPERSRP